MNPVFFRSSGVFMAYRLRMNSNVDNNAYSTSRVIASAIIINEKKRNDSY